MGRLFIHTIHRHFKAVKFMNISATFVHVLAQMFCQPASSTMKYWPLPLPNKNLPCPATRCWVFVDAFNCNWVHVFEYSWVFHIHDFFWIYVYYVRSWIFLNAFWRHLQFFLWKIHSSPVVKATLNQLFTNRTTHSWKLTICQEIVTLHEAQCSDMNHTFEM